MDPTQPRAVVFAGSVFPETSAVGSWGLPAHIQPHGREQQGMRKADHRCR